MINYKETEGKTLQLETPRAGHLAVWHFRLEHADLSAKCVNCQPSMFLTSVLLTYGTESLHLGCEILLVLSPTWCKRTGTTHTDAEAKLMEET